MQFMASSAAPAEASRAPGATAAVRGSHEVRPPEGLARGRYAAPAWFVAAAAGALLAAVLAFFLIKRRRARAQRAPVSISPPSSEKRGPRTGGRRR